MQVSGNCSSWVLLVDDHDDGRELLGEFLTWSGYTVEGCSSGEEAIALIERRGSPGIVITDLSLGFMSGSELAKTLRSQPDTASVPILAVTGYASFDDPDRLFDAVLVKPVILPDLTAVLERLAAGERSTPSEASGRERLSEQRNER